MNFHEVLQCSVGETIGPVLLGYDFPGLVGACGIPGEYPSWLIPPWISALVKKQDHCHH